MPRRFALVLLLILSLHAVGSAAVPKLPQARPEEAGMASAHLAEIDRVVAQAIDEKRLPGCVVAIGRRGRLVFLKAYGDRQVRPARQPMTTDTLFDLASLTKPVATAASVMRLVEQGRLDLNAPLASVLPEFAQKGKEKIRFVDLLTHQGGLIADNHLKDYADGPEKAWARLFALEPKVAPGGKFIYSDVGFMVLGAAVQKAAGQRLDQFVQEQLFRPLGMKDTGYLPEESLRKRAAPTEQREGRWMQGEVHDPRAFALGGVAGHAGLFSTAADLAVYAQMLLGRGRYAGVSVFKPETVDALTEPHSVPGGLRGLGWDVKTGYSSNRSWAYSTRAFGHGGFTGTALWVDPQRELFVIFLSNRVHPDGKGSVNPLAGRIGTIAVEAIQPPSTVLLGIDVLRRDGFKPLQGRQVGLITNHTGLDRRGTSTAAILQQAQGIKLLALFSPEHGLQGRLDVAHIGDMRDPWTGLQAFSLYGKTRRPTDAMLEGLDTLVFDIQDIGTRFYTYISTMGYAMEEAARKGLRFVVLDRPNPIGAVAVEGPMLDPGRESFVAYHRLPIRHGMTIGELACLFRAELNLKLDLVVVPVEGWRRADRFEATGLEWVNPSPNMRSPTEALLYPGIGLLETTNLSVGRGTATPFEWIGAPWLDGPRLAAELNRAGLKGIRFEAVEFTPTSSKFSAERCRGVRFVVTDPEAIRPVRVGLEVARHLARVHPGVWKLSAYDALLGNKAVLEGIRDGKSVAQLEALAQPDLDAFLHRRAKHLLY